MLNYAFMEYNNKDEFAPSALCASPWVGWGVIALCAVGEEQQAASMVILSKYNLSESKFNASMFNLSKFKLYKC